MKYLSGVKDSLRKIEENGWMFADRRSFFSVLSRYGLYLSSSAVCEIEKEEFVRSYAVGYLEFIAEET